MASTASSLAAQHILSHLTSTRRPGKTCLPLFVGLQGPQGSGKSHLAGALVATLSAPPHSLRVAVLSVDDLYLTHEGLGSLARAHPANRLWSGRGQPGTHDVALGTEVLARLHAANSRDDDAGSTAVVLPVFDKAQFSGEGDRAAEGTVVDAPLDVVLFEGWCVGFYPLTPGELDARWESVRREVRDAPEGVVARAMEGIRKEDIVAVNDALRAYARGWYGFLELFVQICPPTNAPYQYIHNWRLEQEHKMKALNGGLGMTDDQVGRFVDRFIPGYVFFGEGVRQGGESNNPPWKGRGLGLVIDQDRSVIDVQNF